MAGINDGLRYNVDDYGGSHVKMFSARMRLKDGVLYWRGGENGAKSYRKELVGKEVKGYTKSGGQFIKVLDRSYKRVDIVYAIMTGSLPADFVVEAKADCVTAVLRKEERNGG